MNDFYLKLNDQLSQHFEIIGSCTLPSKDYGNLLLATPASKRYPYIYPRDTAAAMQLFRRIAGSEYNYDIAPRVFDLMKGVAHFMRDVQSEEGYWGQRYSLQKENKSIYKQEDNTAHGIAIICNYLLTAYKLEKSVAELEDFLHSIHQALKYTLTNYYQKELNLFYSTTSIHESGMEQGYTCWVNFAYLHALHLVEEVVKLLDDKEIISRSLIEFCRNFSYTVNELFMSGERYVRRIDPTGNMDLRPDITLLSPFYFGFVHYKKALEKSVQFLEKQLCDPELNMIMRYLPFYDDFSIHVHAGNGPWLQYTAILAQYHYWNGNMERGDQLLNWIDQYKSDTGEIPEHLSTCKRFDNFMSKEWQTGLDFDKEFYKQILLDDVEFDNILEEANNMKKSYDETSNTCFFEDDKTQEGGYIQFATPLMWSHVEYVRALMVKAKDWWGVQ